MGLLDFIGTPEGQGLLSAAFGAAAGAGRGDPLNNMGRAGLAGLVGYQTALNTSGNNQLRDLQIQALNQKMADDKAQRAWRAGLPGMMEPKLSGTTEQGRMLADQYAGFGEDGAKSLVDAAKYAGDNATLGVNYAPDKAALQKYMMQPDSPYADKLIEQQIIPKSPIKLGADEVLLDPSNYQQLAKGQGKSDVKDGYLVPDGNGGWKIDPTLYQAALGAKKAGAPSMTSITKVNAYEPFKNKVQANMGETLVKNYETLQSIPQTLQALDAAKGYAAQAGNFSGSGGDAKLAMAKFFNNNLGTSIDPNGVKNAEALKSALFYNVMDNLKKMDASPSQQQQQVMQAAFGKLDTDPAALPMIIDFYKGQLLSKAKEHNRRVDQTISGPGGMQFPYDIHVNIPNDPKPNGAKSTIGGGGWSAKVVK